MITIIDYKAGNFRSIERMLNRLGVTSQFTSDVSDIEQADKLILPGVGHFDHGMKNLRESGVLEVLEYKVMVQKVPVLGICLGAQLMTESSEEGKEKGLGWIQANTKKFLKDNLPNNYKIPHMGWTDVLARDVLLTKNLMKGGRFYFVHSYYLEVVNPEEVIFIANYGHNFHAGFARGNVFGVQFHPEKSHHFGMQLLKNFSAI